MSFANHIEKVKKQIDMKKARKSHNTPVFIISENKLFRDNLENYLHENYKQKVGELDFHEYDSVKNCFKDLELFKSNNFVIVNEETEDMVSELTAELNSHLLHNIVLIRTNDKSASAEEMIYSEGEEYVVNAPGIFQQVIEIFNRHKVVDKQAHRYEYTNYLIAAVIVAIFVVAVLTKILFFN